MFDKSELDVLYSALAFHESACIDMMSKVSRDTESHKYWSGRLSQNKAIKIKLQRQDWECIECNHLNNWMAYKCNFCDASKSNA